MRLRTVSGVISKYPIMATASKSAGRKKTSERGKDKIEKVMHEFKEGELESGKSGKKVTSRKQAVAIALSEARETGAKIPKKGGAKKKA